MKKVTLILIADDYGAREAEMLQLPQNNPSWMSANMALRELYDSQESITLRSVKEGALQIPTSGPVGLSTKVKFSLLG